MTRLESPWAKACGKWFTPFIEDQFWGTYRDTCDPNESDGLRDVVIFQPQSYSKRLFQ